MRIAKLNAVLRELYGLACFLLEHINVHEFSGSREMRVIRAGKALDSCRNYGTYRMGFDTMI